MVYRLCHFDRRPDKRPIWQGAVKSSACAADFAVDRVPSAAVHAPAWKGPMRLPFPMRAFKSLKGCLANRGPKILSFLEMQAKRAIEISFEKLLNKGKTKKHKNKKQRRTLWLVPWPKFGQAETAWLPTRAMSKKYHHKPRGNGQRLPGIPEV